MCRFGRSWRADWARGLVGKVPDYFSGSCGFEMLPSETYLLKKFLAADSSGCLLCHNRDKAPPAFEP